MVKFKAKDSKHVLIARDDVQAAAFKAAGLEPATKEDEAKLKGQE